MLHQLDENSEGIFFFLKPTRKICCCDNNIYNNVCITHGIFLLKKGSCWFVVYCVTSLQKKNCQILTYKSSWAPLQLFLVSLRKRNFTTISKHFVPINWFFIALIDLYCTSLHYSILTAFSTHNATTFHVFFSVLLIIYLLCFNSPKNGVSFFFCFIITI